MNYNEACPCCNWKFWVDPDFFGEGVDKIKVTCGKCGSIWYSRKS